MKLAPVRSKAIFTSNRLDARYHAAPAVRIKEVLQSSANVELRSIGDYANVFAPKRFKRAYAAPGEDFVPYLRPYDVFEFLPPEADRLSVSRTQSLEDYEIKTGDLLQTCSGRNLGPVTIADDYLSQFVLSHDMIRVSIEDESDRLYTLAMLQSSLGQSLIRGDLNGSVIDHVTVDQLADIRIPFISGVRDQIAALMREAVAIRESARGALRGIVGRLDDKYEVPVKREPSGGWTVKASALNSRLDAAYNSARVGQLRHSLRGTGGVRLGELAELRKPGGRPKLYYVEPGEGTPFLSGRQILQLDVVGAKSIGARSIDSESGYGLGKGWVVFQADGRAEESLGYPAVVLEDREDWFASGHVGRAIPLDDEHTGWVWSVMAMRIVQEQIEALACGSVVDALYVNDLEEVVVPPFDAKEAALAQKAWDDLSRSARLSRKAIELIEVSLNSIGL